jgi:hypothetical protein
VTYYVSLCRASSHPYIVLTRCTQYLIYTLYSIVVGSVVEQIILNYQLWRTGVLLEYKEKSGHQQHAWRFGEVFLLCCWRLEDLICTFSPSPFPHTVLSSKSHFSKINVSLIGLMSLDHNLALKSLEFLDFEFFKILEVWI